MVWPVIAKLIASQAGSTLLSQGAGSVLGKLGSSGGASGGGLLGAIANPRTAMSDAFKSSALRKLMQDPDEFMQTQVQDFIDNEGRMPDQSEMLDIRAETQKLMNEIERRGMAQAANMRLPMGGFIKQNPNFLNAAQRQLG